jgi:hypothetical protein
MAHPTVKLEGDTLIFSNAQVTIAVETNFPQEPLTVESATLTTPHDNTVDLGITNFEVPPPVVEHVLDQVTPSVASVPNATLSQEGEMVDIAVTDPESFVHIIEGGRPRFASPWFRVPSKDCSAAPIPASPSISR